MGVATSVHGCIYVCGGHDGEPLSSVEQFDPSSHSWTQISPMKVRRDALGAVAVDGAIYVFGGHDGVLRQRSMERFNPQSMSWEMLAHPPQGRNFAAVTAGPC